MAEAFVITVDGPSGAGKGTTSAALARQLGFHLLDSGALYRLTGLAARRAGVDMADAEALGEVARTLPVEFVSAEQGVRVELGGDDVGAAIRTEQAGMDASTVGAVPQVRAALLQCQRDFAKAPGLVADGRDMGTTVFPAAPLKIYLTASAEQRARRRLLQLQEKQGGDLSEQYPQILADIKARDQQDSERASSPLKPATDAVVIDSSDMGIDAVLAQILGLYQRCQVDGGSM
ncbi:MAG: (d)CMP kinase [Cellvibrionaceae bacterium]|nr:(d)CMP kinase [Cellvibrionaceae bacterium]